MGLIETATRRRISVLMFTLAIALFGLVSLSRLKVNLLPDLSYPTVTIRTELPGAAPLEIESLLSKPIEEAVGIIKNVRQVRSVSRSGQSDVILEFVWGSDMDLAGVDVREKIDLLELPDEAKRPLLLRFDPSNEPILRLALSRAAGSSAAQLKELRRLAEDELKKDLESIEGTAAVKASGGLEEEIQVLVDQQRIAQLGIPISTVSERLRAENVNLAGGRLEEGSQRFLVRTVNEFKSIDDIANALIPTQSGRSVYLRDIATVRSGNKERTAITRLNGAESVELAVYKEGDANTVQVAKRVKAALEDIGEQLPDGTTLTEVYDQSVFIDDAIKQVQAAAIIGGLLAVLVLYFFLRDAKATAIIAVAIPVSVIGTFTAMYAAGITLNIMSLGGIALAVGLLVDNSIVVLENIVRQRESGKNVLDAARIGTEEVAGAVTAATLTTVAVFFPMVFVSGIAGQLFRDQALTVTFALLFSLLVALTLIPMLAAWSQPSRYQDADAAPEPVALSANRFVRFLQVVARAVGAGLTWFIVKLIQALRLTWRATGWLLGFLLRPFVWVVQTAYGFLARIYPSVLRAGLNQRLLVLVIAGVLLVWAASLVPRLGTELIPQLSQGEFQVDFKLPAGTPLDRTDRAMLVSQEQAQKIANLDVTYAVAGTGNRLDASPVDAGENSGRLNVRLQPGATRADEDAAMGVLRDALQSQPGVQYNFSRPALFSTSTPVEVEVSGYNLEQLSEAATRVKAVMEANPRFADVKSSVAQGNPEIRIEFDHDRAANLGLLVRDVADRIVTKVRGNVATRYTLHDRKIDVLVRGFDSTEASVDDIRRLIVNPLSERPVTLSSIADIRIESGPAEIRRNDQQRVAVLSANLAYGDLGTAVAELEAALPQTRIPGTDVRVAGQNAEMTESFASMRFTLILAIFLVYLVMAAQFESIVQPLVILFTVPLALVGAVIALYVTGTTINVVVFIGAIMLTGIVVNNAIVLVDLINQLRAQGHALMDAIMEASSARLRPIVMTTTTTTLGLLPMALGFGDGAEVRAPMAITVIGGLVLSTLLTLVVIPVVYSLFEWRPGTQAGQLVNQR